MFGGAAVVVLLSAGALLWSPAQATPSEPTSEELPSEGEEAIDLSTLTPKNPLELGGLLVDAGQRAKIWDATAQLSGISLTIKDSRPQGPVVFEFGAALGPPQPGAPLSTKRHTIRYEGENVTPTSDVVTTARRALPDPNCPLDAAFRALTEGAKKVQQPIEARYLYAESNRAIWQMKSADGAVARISGDSCARIVKH
jgi:hypothetical protein